MHEDGICICFRDISPQAPQHILIVPKKRIVRVGLAETEDKETLGHLLLTAQEVARKEGFLESGFRTVINSGPDSGEEVPHLHLHILAGRPLGPIVS